MTIVRQKYCILIMCTTGSTKHYLEKTEGSYTDTIFINCTSVSKVTEILEEFHGTRYCNNHSNGRAMKVQIY